MALTEDYIKLLTVSNGDYKITTREDGNIKFDVGNNGEVRITGNLSVEGEQTIVNTTDLSIEDKIIVLNRNETGPGISGNGLSGMEIARGSLPHARLVFDENTRWTDPANPGTSDAGAWSLQDINGRILAIETVSIATDGANLNLIGETNAGFSNGVVSVYGTADYENQVIDDDHIPNKKYVDDLVSTYFLSNFSNRIDDGFTTVSFIEVQDFERTGLDSKISIGIDGNEVIAINATDTTIEDVRITNNIIETVNEFDDLVLQANGTGNVKINDALLLDPTPHLAFGGAADVVTDPSAPTTGVKLYSKTQGEGATNVYYVNETGRRDELVSKNRALLFSMLF